MFRCERIKDGREPEMEKLWTRWLHKQRSSQMQQVWRGWSCWRWRWRWRWRWIMNLSPGACQLFTAVKHVLTWIGQTIDQLALRLSCSFFLPTHQIILNFYGKMGKLELVHLLLNFDQIIFCHFCVDIQKPDMLWLIEIKQNNIIIIIII